MTHLECLELLELPASATQEQIKRAYRRLAQKLHPDKHGGDEASRRQFVAVGTAYHLLVQRAQVIKSGKPMGACARCGGMGEVSVGLDGALRCRNCVALQLGGHVLPFSELIVVKCAAPLILLAAAIYFLILAFPVGHLVYLAAAFAAGLLSLVALAYTCLTVPYCVRKRDWDAVIRSQQIRNRRWGLIRG